MPTYLGKVDAQISLLPFVLTLFVLPLLLKGLAEAKAVKVAVLLLCTLETRPLRIFLSHPRRIFLTEGTLVVKYAPENNLNFRIINIPPQFIHSLVMGTLKKLPLALSLNLYHLAVPRRIPQSYERTGRALREFNILDFVDLVMARTAGRCSIPGSRPISFMMTILASFVAESCFGIASATYEDWSSYFGPTSTDSTSKSPIKCLLSL
ncbi:uncharacterized protein BDR25DRAFT_360731 [Lindgomyces ingoldianus]|uniref:Uncharacterized protein n=1 Tax=Lindgomyces ingoldianus TaxID=673940 RepID=A0ACB6QEQ5_9PLEO|nr:uncharacterized protein BDR25DRAFT_360731 [Lindgomyces ingoldianus]KAF2465377.1 hypothetical protein BDR25DRAFT_360731 [Lindgomyces ingoldianus]